MKTIKRLGILVPICLIIGAMGLGGCGDDDDDGACIIGSGITSGCAEMGENMCNTMNGTAFYKDTSCSDLGYNG